MAFEENITSISSNTIHIVSQSLLIPVMAVLVIFFIYSLINLGTLISEYYYRRKVKIDFKNLQRLILSVSEHESSDEIMNIIEESALPRSHKEVLITVLESSKLGPDSREALARKMVEDEEITAAKKLEKTDIIAKIAPAVGLMGTLIPLGPGLTALGAGDIQNLADHLMMAFDAAVLGMASAAIGFTISKIRRRWYEEEISTLDSLAESILEVLKF
ncbi:MotA/TolQ/ExbB proton channel family protein [Methanobacterium sp. SMA-27]|uniref:MotA/TolQ/ExbB proton channel family protein n=1 Tax=Methanobacterium sp. SMA-27 TaxID=1495336 RepID=UPI00064FB8D8|nr:MotA/TolQ/ExbB proton channel family protein [Methanobacterium sp. SMA-27]